MEDLKKLNKILKRLWKIDVIKSSMHSQGITGGLRSIKNTPFPYHYLGSNSQTNWALKMKLISEHDGLALIDPNSAEGKEITKVFLHSITSTTNSSGGKVDRPLMTELEVAHGHMKAKTNKQTMNLDEMVDKLCAFVAKKQFIAVWQVNLMGLLVLIVSLKKRLTRKKC